ncbi:COPII coat assembly protein sec16 [Madurella mycetomatis]|uniref:COPII coat assembly protein sec16 n=1 Tax=Madurella mycetomatis TaxID=100816 RepID=A0A175VU42_9PEZI|nr:COPII coat assembly protein sec16 [Madurella mycetomatis]KXX74709.1 COPII coat assembly protein sec16 [Madurella mycetomatis]
MAWDKSSWLAFARSLQLLGAASAAAAQGYVIIQINVRENVVILELLIIMLLVYSALVSVFLHAKRRVKSTVWLACSTICDIFCCGALIAIITILANFGFPTLCGGMGPDSTGFCTPEIYFYFVAIALIFSYIATLLLTVCCIFELNHTKNTKVNELLESLQRADDINLKVFKALDPPSPPPRTPVSNLPPRPPASEGIISRATSFRSTVTMSTPSGPSAYRPGSFHHGLPLIPRRPVPPPSSSGSASPGPGGNSWPGPVPPAPSLPLPLPLDGPETDNSGFEAALVANGMQHQHEPQHPYQQHRRSFSGDRHRKQQQQQQQHVPPQALPILSEEERMVDAALVSDGMRPEAPLLPPYQPGSARMAGHDGESNEMRLSEYVKGETRAQDMKDSGRY